MVSRNAGAQMPERSPSISQMPSTTNAALRNMKASPPMYLKTSSVGRWIGLTSSRSMVPLRSMLGMKKAVMIRPMRMAIIAPSQLTRLSSMKAT